MSNGSSGNSADKVNRARSWKDPNGLGWQLWRRSQSAGLLTQSIQRDLAQFRATILREPAPLAYDIRRRWGVGANTGAAQVGLDLPFFLGRFPFFRHSTPEHLSGTGSWPERSPANAGQISLAYQATRSPAATALQNPPDREADTPHGAPAIFRRGANGSEQSAVDSLVNYTVSLRPQFVDQRQSGEISAQVARAMSSARGSLTPQAPIAPVHAVPLNRGILSGAIFARHNSTPALLQRASFTASPSENRFFGTVQRPPPGSSAVIAATTVGETRRGARPALDPVPQAAEAEPGRRSSNDLQSAGLPGPAGAEPVSHALPLTPGAAAVTVGSAPSITRREVSIGAVEKESIAQRDGVSGGAGALPGVGVTGRMSRSPGVPSPARAGLGSIALAPSSGFEARHVPRAGLISRGQFAFAEGMTISRIAWPSAGNSRPNALASAGARAGLILPTPGIYPLVGAKPSLPMVTRLQAARISSAPDNLYFTSSFGARGFLPVPITPSYGLGPRIAPAGRALEPGIESRDASSAAEDSIARKSVSGELPSSADAPGGSHSAVGASPPGMIAQPQTIDRSESRRPAVDVRPSESGGQIPALDVWAVGSPIAFAARHASRAREAPATAIAARFAAMPLSIAPVFTIERSSAGSSVPSIFRELAMSPTPKIARHEYQESSATDDVSSGGESEPKLGSSSDAGSQALQTRGTFDHNLLLASAGFKAIRHAGAGESLQGWLPLYRGGLSEGSVPVARHLIQRATVQMAAPMLIARSADIPAAMVGQPMATISGSRAIQSAESFSPGWIAAALPAESSEVRSQKVGLRPALASVGALAISPSALMRWANFSARQQPLAPVAETIGMRHEMPLAALSVMRDERGFAALHPPNGSAVQTAPQRTLPAANRLLPVDGGAERGGGEAPAAAAKRNVDLDELVEKAWQKLMRKFTIEHERRGYSRWL